MSYVAPVKDMLFNLQHLAQIEQIASMPGFEDAGLETAQAVLEECARFNQDVVAPLNWESDKHPSHWKEGHVTTSPGFKQAYKQYAEGGWQGLQHPRRFWRPRFAQNHWCGVWRNAQCRQFEFCVVPVVDRWRD